MILEETFLEKHITRWWLLRKIQSEAVLALDGKCIYGYCTSEMMEEYGVTTKDLDAVVASIRNVDGVEVAMFFVPVKWGFIQSQSTFKELRGCKQDCRWNGGGGHVRAAGAEIHGELNDIINKLLNRINRTFKMKLLKEFDGIND